MASKCKFLYILTVRLRARKPTIKIVGFLARKFYNREGLKMLLLAFTSGVDLCGFKGSNQGFPL